MPILREQNWSTFVPYSRNGSSLMHGPPFVSPSQPRTLHVSGLDLDWRDAQIRLHSFVCSLCLILSISLDSMLKHLSPLLAAIRGGEHLFLPRRVCRSRAKPKLDATSHVHKTVPLQVREGAMGDFSRAGELQCCFRLIESWPDTWKVSVKHRPGPLEL